MTTSRDRRLDAKVVLVTGGAGGIGAAQVRASVRAGADLVVIGDLDVDRGTALAAELAPRATFVPLDVTSESSWTGTLRAVRRAAGRPVDVLLHTAGIIRAGLLADFDVESFRRVVDVNLTGLFLGLKSVAPEMASAGGGAVVAISSVDAFAAVPTFGAYAAAKAGVLALVRAAAIELAPRRIRVNAVAPGAVDTPMTRAPGDDPAGLASFARQIPWGRVGLPQDVAEASLYLASDAAEFITGATLTVDGGSMARISLSLDGWSMPGE